MQWKEIQRNNRHQVWERVHVWESSQRGYCVWGRFYFLSHLRVESKNYNKLVNMKKKNPPAMQELQVWSLGLENPLEEATHSSVLAWRILWTEQPGGLRPIGWQRVRYDRNDWACTRAHSVTTFRHRDKVPLRESGMNSGFIPER